MDDGLKNIRALVGDDIVDRQLNKALSDYFNDNNVLKNKLNICKL